MTVKKHPAAFFPQDLVYVHEAEEATGIPRSVIRQWASRGKINKFPGDGRATGKGHSYRTMYALPEIRELAKSYRAAPQRRPSRP
ncbi:hypothetical protein AB0G42_10195 [Streptomyces yangpuensis]|uniref:hypothetical protein n=1 Tax=Streptomyces yangpuensis TaxID=1648182 RepID=UPI0034318BE1